MRTLLLIAAVGAACGTQPSGQSAVFPAAATMFELDVASGGIAPGAGSTCTPGVDSYSYVLATRGLTWHQCTSPTPGGVYTIHSGQTTLDKQTATQLVDELRALEPPPQTCAVGDFSAKLVVTTSTGTDTNSNAACLTGIDNVITTVSSAVP